ncbi:MAG: hypothetical protein AB1798_06615 [Spirochaetota bacterium]
MQMTTLEILQLFQNLERFYNSAWINLLIVSGIIVIVIGVLWPLYLNARRQQKYRLAEAAIIQRLEKAIEEGVSAAQKDLEEKVKAAEERLEKSLAENVRLQSTLGKYVEAMHHHVQGVADLATGKPAIALKSFLLACKASLTSGRDEQTFPLFYQTLKGAIAEAKNKSDIQQNEGAARDLIEILKQSEEAVFQYFAQDLETIISDKLKIL